VLKPYSMIVGMKDNKLCIRESRRARPFKSNPVPLRNEGTGCGSGRKNLTTQNHMTTKTMTEYIAPTRGQMAVSASGRRPLRTSVGNARLALTGTDWSWADNHLQARCRRPLNHFMKIKIALGLCIVLGAGFSSFGVADNPAQAAARAALEQKLQQPNAWEPQPLTEMTSLPSVAMVEPSGKSVAGVARTASAKAVTPQTVPATTPRVAAPVPAAPVVMASASVAPAVVASATFAPTASEPVMTAPTRTVSVMSLLMLSFLVASLFAVMVLLLKLRQLKLKLRESDSRF
jgi:hypothetical protein